MKKRRVLKDVLKEQGRTQAWLIKELSEKGVDRSVSVFNLYCNGHDKPRDRYILDLISELIQVEPQVVYECFEPYN